MSMPQQFKLTWSPNLGDMKTGFALAAWGTRGRLLRTVVLLFILPSVMFSIMLLNMPVHNRNVAAAVAIGIVGGCLFGLLFLPLFSSVFGRKMVLRQRERGGIQTILITEEGVERQLTATSIRHSWQTISRVDELPAAFLLYSGGTLVGSIEKSSVANTHELAALRAFIRAKKPGRTFESTFFALESKHGGEA